jgi:hypothetical protein
MHVFAYLDGFPPMREIYEVRRQRTCVVSVLQNADTAIAVPPFFFCKTEYSRERAVWPRIDVGEESAAPAAAHIIKNLAHPAVLRLHPSEVYG